MRPRSLGRGGLDRLGLLAEAGLENREGAHRPATGQVVPELAALDLHADERLQLQDEPGRAELDLQDRTEAQIDVMDGLEAAAPRHQGVDLGPERDDAAEPSEQPRTRRENGAVLATTEGRGQLVAAGLGEGHPQSRFERAVGVGLVEDRRDAELGLRERDLQPVHPALQVADRVAVLGEPRLGLAHAPLEVRDALLDGVDGALQPGHVFGQGLHVLGAEADPEVHQEDAGARLHGRRRLDGAEALHLELRCDDLGALDRPLRLRLFADVAHARAIDPTGREAADHENGGVVLRIGELLPDDLTLVPVLEPPHVLRHVRDREQHRADAGVAVGLDLAIARLSPQLVARDLGQLRLTLGLLHGLQGEAARLAALVAVEDTLELGHPQAGGLELALGPTQLSRGLLAAPLRGPELLPQPVPLPLRHCQLRLEPIALPFEGGDRLEQLDHRPPLSERARRQSQQERDAQQHHPGLHLVSSPSYRSGSGSVRAAGPAVGLDDARTLVVVGHRGLDLRDLARAPLERQRPHLSAVDHGRSHRGTRHHRHQQRRALDARDHLRPRVRRLDRAARGGLDPAHLAAGLLRDAHGGGGILVAELLRPLVDHRGLLHHVAVHERLVVDELLEDLGVAREGLLDQLLDRVEGGVDVRVVRGDRVAGRRDRERQLERGLASRLVLGPLVDHRHRNPSRREPRLRARLLERAADGRLVGLVAAVVVVAVDRVVAVIVDAVRAGGHGVLHGRRERVAADAEQEGRQTQEVDALHLCHSPLVENRRLCPPAAPVAYRSDAAGGCLENQ